jgi:hypothetical protein
MLISYAGEISKPQGLATKRRDIADGRLLLVIQTLGAVSKALKFACRI